MLELELRRKLIQYILGNISLREFQQWFVPTTWDIHLSTEPGAIDLTYKVELRLAEYTSGHLPENQLRREFGELLSKATFSMSSSPLIQTSSSSQPIEWQLLTSVAEGQSQSSGTLSVVELS